MQFTIIVLIKKHSNFTVGFMCFQIGMHLELVDFDEVFLDASYLWLQDFELRYLIDSDLVTKYSQQQWFNSLKEKKGYFIMGIKYNGFPIGVVGIKNIMDDKGEYWGYIGEKSLWGIGIGKWMLEKTLSICKEKSINKLYLRVLESNKRARGLYEKYGFLRVGYIDNFVLMEKILM